MPKDFVDDGLVSEAKIWLQKQHIENFHDLQRVGTTKILDYGKAEVEWAEVNVEELIRLARMIMMQMSYSSCSVQ